MLKIKTASAVQREEELIRKAKAASAKMPRTSDRSDYESSQRQLHDKALEIRAYINETYPAFCEEHPALKTFRASYGWSSDPETQEVQLVIRLARENNDIRLTLMLLTAQEINTEMLYEAEKLCIENPQPFYEVWADELGPYVPSNSSVGA